MAALDISLQLCFPRQGLVHHLVMMRSFLALLQWDNGGFPWWLATSKVCKLAMVHMTKLAGTVVYALNKHITCAGIVAVSHFTCIM